MTRQPYVPREPTAVKVWIVSPTGELRPGLYRARLIKQGPFIPVSLALIDGDRDELGRLMSDQSYRLLIEGEERDWRKYEALLGEPIDAAEYRYLMEIRKHDVVHETTLADARAPIDPLTSPLPF